MRFTTLIVLMGMILSVGTVLGNGPDPLSQEKMIARTYDLSYLRSDPLDFSMSGLHECLFPFSRNQGMEADGEEYDFNPSRIMELIYDFFGDEEFDREGVEMADRGKHLFVMGPESLHLRIDQFLQFLNQRMNRKVTLEVKAYVMEGAPLTDLTTPDAIQLAAEQGERLRTVLSTVRECRLGERITVKSGSEKNIVWDYETEIAQGSIMLEPLVAPLFLGLSLDVRTQISPDNNKIQLALFSRFSRLLEPVQRRNGAFSGRLVTENSINTLFGERSMDDPKIEFAGVAATLVAEPGMPVLLSTAFPHHKGLGSLVLALTVHVTPAPQEIDLGKNRILTARNIAIMDDPLDFCSNRIWEERFRSFNWQELSDDSDPTMVYLGFPGTYTLDDNNLEGVYHAYETIQGGDFLMPEDEYSFQRLYHQLGHESLFLAGRAFIDLSMPVIDNLLTANTDALHIELKCVEHEGPAVLEDELWIEQKGILKGSLSLPLAKGGTARSMAGFEGLMIRGYEVDVATRAGACTPIVAGFLDGAFIHLNHVPAYTQAKGGGHVRAVLSLNRLIDSHYSRDMGEGGGVLGLLDTPEFDHAFMDARFAVDGEPHVLGSLTRIRDGQAKTLYVIGRAMAK